MSTEHLSPRSTGLDQWPAGEVMAALIEGQLAALAAVAARREALTDAAVAAAARLEGGGRLAYAGAGTSGRLATLDGVELAPTFGWPRDRLAFLLAGGPDALTQSREGAEDDAKAGAAEASGLGAADVLISVAASGGTPYTVAAQAVARAAGCLTIALAGVAGSALLAGAEHPILLDTGAEVIAGSTRMKAGTAQKAALTVLSSTIMIRLGHVHDGLMVDVQPTNAKLVRRARAMVASIAGCLDATAEDCLARANGQVKLAVLLARGMSEDAAKAALTKAKGRLRLAMAGR